MFATTLPTMKAVPSSRESMVLLLIVLIFLTLVQRIDGAKHTLRREPDLAREDHGFWNRILMTNH
jgi:hypothetical protein